MIDDTHTYHAVFAVGHFARCLQARTVGRRGSFHALAVLQHLWLRTDPLASAPIVNVSLDDLIGIVANAERFRQVVAELTAIGAVERVDYGLTRSLRLFKPRVEDLDAIARAQIHNAAAQAEHARVELERAQRLNGSSGVGGESVRASASSKAERDAVLTRMGKRPSDVRDVLAAMAGVPEASLRYSGPGSGPVQAAVGWLAEKGATWEGLTLLCEHVRSDVDRPAHDLVWLFGEQHRAYRESVVAHLLARRREQAPDTQGEAAAQRGKLLAEMAPSDVERWLKNQAKDERAIEELWGNESAVAVLLNLTGPEATQRIQAWQVDPTRSLVEHFA